MIERLEPRAMLAAVITASNVDTLVVDVDADGFAEAGDQIHYTVTVQNTGDADATNLTFQEIINNPHLTLLAGSINVSPLAINDTFTAVANTQLRVGTPAALGGPASVVAGNVLANDMEFLGDTVGANVVIDAFDAASAGGGTVSMVTVGANRGSFYYVPQAGDTGADSFTYTLRDDGIDNIPGNADDLFSIGTVNITIGTNQVWYVDNSSDAVGDGTSSNPFDSLADVSAGAGPDGSGDIIYLSTGSSNYGGGIILTANETLWGQGQALIVDAFTLQAAGSDPILESAGGDSVTVNSGNTLQGFTIGNSLGFDITNTAATSVGTLTVSNVILNGTGGLLRADAGGALNVTLDGTATTSTNASGHGFHLVNTTGSLTANSVSISGVTGTDVLISGGTVSATFSGNITKTANAAMVSVSGGHATGTITFQSGTLTTNNGTGLQFDNADGTYNFNGTTTLNGGNAGIDILNGSGGTFGFGTGATITNPTGGAVVVDTGSASVTYSGLISNNAGRMISVSNTTGGFVTFNSATANALADSGSGILIDGAAGNVTVNNGDLNGTRGIEILGDATNNATGTFTFNNVTIDTTAGATNHAFIVDGDQGTASNNDVNATIDLNNVDITNPGGQVVTIQGMNGGSVDFDSASAISRTNSGLGILANSNAGGTIAFNSTTKTLTTGANAAVNLTSNTGATINFVGGNLDIDTTSGAGFTATGGGTISVQGTVNTIDATSGGGLNVANTTISASGLTFQRISSGAGANNGIVLDTTGASGGLTVTGSGGAGSGGIISGKTGGDGVATSGIGIFLNSTINVSLTRMDIQGNQNFGIRGNNVTGFTLDNSTIGTTTTNGTSNTADIDAANYQGEGSVRFFNLFGTATISNSTLDRGFGKTVAVANNSGTLTNLIIDNSTLRNSLTATTASDALYLEAEGASTTTNLTVQNNSQFTSFRQNAIQTNAQTGTTMNISIAGSTFRNTNTAYVNASNALVFNGTGTSTFVTFDLNGNTLTHGDGVTDPFVATGVNPGRLMTAGMINGAGTFHGKIRNNTFGTSGVAHTGGGNGADAIGFFAGGGNGSDGGSRLLVEDNIIQRYGQAGIQIGAVGDGIGNINASIDATIQGNTIRQPGAAAQGAFAAIWGYAGNAAGDINVLNIVIGSAGTAADKNTMTDSDPNNLTDVFLGNVGIAGSPINLFRNGSGAGTVNGASDAQINAVLVADNNATLDLGGAGHVQPINLVDGVPTLPPLMFMASADDVPPSSAPPTSDPVDYPTAAVQPPAGYPQPANPPADPPVTPPANPPTTPPTASEPPVIVDDGLLSQAELDSLVAAAIARWEATGLTAEQVSLLQGVTFTIEDLSGWYLGAAGDGVVTLDSNAAGNSWFIDATPFDDSEFSGTGTDLKATATGGAKGRIDALTTIMHELGHQLGLEDHYITADSANLMYGWINQSQRRLPAAGQAEGADPHAHDGESGPDFLFGVQNIGTLPAGKSLTIVYDATVNNLMNGVAPLTVTSQLRFIADGGIDVLSDDPSIVGVANPTETPFDQLVLGNQVWGDTNGNGLLDGGETGINSVTVNLYADANNDDVKDGAAIDSISTIGGGLYSFNVLPGNYIVEVAAANFLSTAALEGMISTGGAAADPDNNTDNDDNGVNNGAPGINGISSLAITMAYGTEPTQDGSAQFDINNTLDFGFKFLTTVTNINDTGLGSLRAAIDNSNLQIGTQTIDFAIAGAGVHTIQPATALPDVTDTVIIDGTTQGVSVTPLIELDGTNAGAGALGLKIKTGGSTVKGLAINRFGGAGIRLVNGNSNIVVGNLIGTNTAGTADLGNAGDGVQIVNSDNNTIGGLTAADRNLISGNTRYGVSIDAASTGNVVEGNLIGTNLAGTGDLGNTLSGVLILSASNTIGGTAAGARNIISGNDQHGVHLTTAAVTSNLVQGNYIGTDINGTADLGNTQSGVQIDGGAASNTIGGTTVAARNIISGNNGYGVRLQTFGTTTNNNVQGNYIGTDVNGTAAIGNSLSGVQVNATGNTIGGTVAGAGNLISGNVQHGVLIQGGSNVANNVQGNLIGTSANGTADLGNTLDGVQVLNSSGNLIGGTTALTRNIISGNNANGVNLTGSGSSDNSVLGNYIGTNLAGTADLGNMLSGILVTSANNDIGSTLAGSGNLISGNDRFGITIQGSAATGNDVKANLIGTNAAGTGAIGNSLSGITLYDAGSNTVGGTTASARNVISGNVQQGVYLSQDGATGNVVQGNFIGTDINGTADLGNTLNGVLLDTIASSNTIGGTAAGAGNVISGNNQHGVYLLGFGGVGVGVRLNLVQGNFIGTDVNGTADLGNTLNGVMVQATANTIGGTAAGAGNLISGNNQNGVQLQGGVNAATLVQGNRIGTQADGTSALGNSQHGVQIVNSSDNSIGGTTAGSGNTIAFNTQDGVTLIGSDTATSNNAIQGNSIFSNGGLGIDLNDNGLTPNDVDDPDQGPNHLQNFPALTSVVLNGPNLDITYSVPSTILNSTYPMRIEFYIADAANQEGKTFLGSDLYLAPGVKLATVSAGAAIVGTKIVATATDANGNTSEFCLFTNVT